MSGEDEQVALSDFDVFDFEAGDFSSDVVFDFFGKVFDCEEDAVDAEQGDFCWGANDEIAEILADFDGEDFVVGGFGDFVEVEKVDDFEGINV